MKILIVDDDSILRRILHAHLTHIGYEVIEAEDGRAGWDLWQREGIRFVITDWLMPNVEGIDLIQRIRAAEVSRYTYIIMLTIKEEKDEVVAGLESGADDYLVKPFHPNELRARVAIGERILNLEARLSEALAHMEILATHDSLTELLNRRAISAIAEKEISRSERTKFPISFVMMDIDHFKTVNDQYGHSIGDQVLRMVADTLMRNKRPYDEVGRWGGEEFLLVLPETNLQEGGGVAERLRLAIENASLPFADGSTLSVQASFGVASISEGEHPNLNALLQHADLALYDAKQHGRNRVCLFSRQARSCS
jgi:two-component system chemotaxis response regulator CheY